MQQQPEQQPQVETPPTSIEQAWVTASLMAGTATMFLGLNGLFSPEEFNTIVENSSHTPLAPGFTIELLRNAGVPDTATAVALLGLASYFLVYQMERKAEIVVHMRDRLFQRIGSIFRGNQDTP